MGNTVDMYKIRKDSVRFIPTCVGNTLRQPCIAKIQGGSSPLAWGIRMCGTRPILSSTVHPHLRGEYRFNDVCHGFVFGSSPLAWGILVPDDGNSLVCRFIPTCVGNTSRHNASMASNCGSSPLAWGIHTETCIDSWYNTVHPHLRGEY